MVFFQKSKLNRKSLQKKLRRKKYSKTRRPSMEEKTRFVDDTQSRKEVWMRSCDNKKTWKLMTKVDSTDEQAIENEINAVASGFKFPSNPHSVQLPSGRRLKFNWESDPSTHSNVISNITIAGDRAVCILEKRYPN